MLELAITPSILRGKRQAPPGATLKAPVELMLPVDSVPAIGHSEAACADEIDAKPGAARTMAKANAFDRRKPLYLFLQPIADAVFRGATLIWIKEASGQDSDISAHLQDVRFTPLKS